MYNVPFVAGNLILEALLACLWVFLPVSLLDWWHAPGFQMVATWPLHIRGYKALFLSLFLLHCLLPLLLLTFSQTIHQTALPTIVLIAVVCLLVGIADEGLFRGLVLNIFLPKGIWRAVVLSALLFGSLHILNIFAGFPLYGVFAEMLSALGSGLFLAAVRVRTNSLRPGIIAHGLWDFPLIILNMHRQRITSPSLGVALIVGGSFCAISVVCTLIVLRPKKMRELRVMYGFVRPKEEVLEQAG